MFKMGAPKNIFLTISKTKCNKKYELTQKTISYKISTEPQSDTCLIAFHKFQTIRDFIKDSDEIRLTAIFSFLFISKFPNAMHTKNALQMHSAGPRGNLLQDEGSKANAEEDKARSWDEFVMNFDFFFSPLQLPATTFVHKKHEIFIVTVMPCSTITSPLLPWFRKDFSAK